MFAVVKLFVRVLRRVHLEKKRKRKYTAR